MSRAIVVTDIISLKVWTSFANQACVTTFDFSIQASSFVGGMTDAQLVQEWDGLAAPIFKPMMGTVAVYHGTQLTYLNVTPLPATESYAGNNGAGTAAAPLMPTQVRGLTKRLTAFAGRKYRGRVYWPFPSSAFSTTSNATTAAYTALMLAATTAIAPVGGLALTTGGNVTLLPILWNRAARLGTFVTGYANTTTFATQRKSGALGRANSSPI